MGTDIVQFGEGNFLRAFVDYMFDRMNKEAGGDYSVSIVKPIRAGSIETLRDRGCRYSLLIRGNENGREICSTYAVDSVKRALCAYEDYDAFMDLSADPDLSIIVSNTTEAGIRTEEADRFEDTPPLSYPAKLTKFLFARFSSEKTRDRELYILPCELIKDNGAELERCVFKTAARWDLGEGFLSYLREKCFFLTTLVDRIVTGYNKNEAEKYSDPLLDICEPFALWVIEDKGNIKKVFPAEKARLPVVFTKDVGPYRERKVRILNGAHTSIVAAGLLSGKETVYDCMTDPVFADYFDSLLSIEVLPTLSLDRDDVLGFVMSTKERFLNPFLDHKLRSILLNSVSKFKARLWDSAKEYYMETGFVPEHIAFAFASLVKLYVTSDSVPESEEIKKYFLSLKGEPDPVGKVVSDNIFDIDFSAVPGFSERAKDYYAALSRAGVREVMACI